MKPQAFSRANRGTFVTIDGPSGAGKSTVVRHLAQMLVAIGEDVHVTAEPSNGPIGDLCRALTPTVTGHALACLYAADRYHHVETEIRPLVAAGKIVISDRYVPSALVMQRFDGVDPAFLWQLNAEADRPDLAVILEADDGQELRAFAAADPVVTTSTFSQRLSMRSLNSTHARSIAPRIITFPCPDRPTTLN